MNSHMVERTKSLTDLCQLVSSVNLYTSTCQVCSSEYYYDNNTCTNFGARLLIISERIMDVHVAANGIS